jgi:hypothetical protein
MLTYWLSGCLGKDWHKTLSCLKEDYVKINLHRQTMILIWQICLLLTNIEVHMPPIHHVNVCNQ